MKTGQKASYSGVLIPELNYRNYKTFEVLQPEMEKLSAVKEVDCENSSIMNDVLWFIGGLAIGAVAVSVSR